jgi:hypothetical protein
MTGRTMVVVRPVTTIWTPRDTKELRETLATLEKLTTKQEENK